MIGHGPANVLHPVGETTSAIGERGGGHIPFFYSSATILVLMVVNALGTAGGGSHAAAGGRTTVYRGSCRVVARMMIVGWGDPFHFCAKRAHWPAIVICRSTS
jgi:hypothetical protein